MLACSWPSLSPFIVSRGPTTFVSSWISRSILLVTPIFFILLPSHVVLVSPNPPTLPTPPPRPVTRPNPRPPSLPPCPPSPSLALPPRHVARPDPQPMHPPSLPNSMSCHSRDPPRPAASAAPAVASALSFPTQPYLPPPLSLAAACDPSIPALLPALSFPPPPTPPASPASTSPHHSQAVHLPHRRVLCLPLPSHAQQRPFPPKNASLSRRPRQSIVRSTTSPRGDCSPFLEPSVAPLATQVDEIDYRKKQVSRIEVQSQTQNPRDLVLS